MNAPMTHPEGRPLAEPWPDIPTGLHLERAYVSRTRPATARQPDVTSLVLAWDAPPALPPPALPVRCWVVRHTWAGLNDSWCEVPVYHHPTVTVPTTPGTRLTFTVRAVGHAGQRSGWSAPFTVLRAPTWDELTP